jgi:hypothetical protein
MLAAIGTVEVVDDSPAGLRTARQPTAELLVQRRLLGTRARTRRLDERLVGAEGDALSFIAACRPKQ